VACVRALAQSGLNPANCRLLDPLETVFSGVGDGSHAILVLGFESADHPLQPWMARALELVREHGGEFDAEAVARSMAPEGADVQRMGAQAHRTGAAGAWRDAFLRMPYWRDPAVGLGVIMDTFETAITWDRFEAFYTAVKADVSAAIQRATGNEALLSCRFTHVYPDGPAPYFTLAVNGSTDGSVASALAAWRDIKAAANEAVTTARRHHHPSPCRGARPPQRLRARGRPAVPSPARRRQARGRSARGAQSRRTVRPAGADGGYCGSITGALAVQRTSNAR
jgi:alkyldihydroxyacetonephosphate synthase